MSWLTSLIGLVGRGLRDLVADAQLGPTRELELRDFLPGR